MCCSQSCATLRHPMNCSPPGSPWDSPGKNTGEDCYPLLQGIFLSKPWMTRLCYLLIHSSPSSFLYSFTPFVHPSIHPFIHSPIHLSFHLSIHPFIHSSIYFFLPFLHIHSLRSFIHPPIHPFIQVSIHLFFHSFIHSFTHSFSKHSGAPTHPYCQEIS